MLKILIVIISVIASICAGARILAIAPFPSYSHQIYYRPIWKALADRGHQVLLLTTDPIEDQHPNIEQIDLHFVYNVRNKIYNLTNVAQENEYNIPKIFDIYEAMSDDIVDLEMQLPQVQTLLQNNDEQQHFDLMIVEYVHPVFFAFAHKFNCPYITVTSMEVVNIYHKILGNPIHPVLYPEMVMPFEIDLNFKQRLFSTMYVAYGIFKKHFYNYQQEEMARKYFGNDLPSLKTLARNVSLVFINVNPIFNVRPLGPGFIRIGGGLHIREARPLPQDLKDYLDEANEGVVYFSLGTNVKSHNVKKAFINAALEAFKGLPYKVLWKFETDLERKSDNVKIIKWLPQQDVLRHKNVKVFITQCGMQSLEEAIFSHKPMIAIPFIADQKINARRMVRKGLGIMLDKNNITAKILRQSILELINNPSYCRNIDAIAALMADEPMTNLDKVVWWTEYVIRHRGVHHFWHSNLDLPTYQYLLLDVIGFLVLIFFVVLFLSYMSIKLISQKIFFSKIVKEKVN